LTIQAAKSGLGLALVPTFLIEPELAKGELVPVDREPMHSLYDYYLVSPVERSNFAPLAAFREWLQKEARNPT
jgi:LysR family transcriptional regulator, glycine cleavage system transcriptional activator